MLCSRGSICLIKLGKANREWKKTTRNLGYNRCLAKGGWSMGNSWSSTMRMSWLRISCRYQSRWLKTMVRRSRLSTYLWKGPKLCLRNSSQQLTISMRSVRCFTSRKSKGWVVILHRQEEQILPNKICSMTVKSADKSIKQQPNNALRPPSLKRSCMRRVSLLRIL